MENSKEFNEGFEACEPEYSPGHKMVLCNASWTNPYPEGTREYDEWKMGFFTAIEKVSKCLQ